MPSILGPIIQLQIQRSPLKVGQKPDRRYITDPLLQVERLRLTPDGVIGLAQGAALIDVHHRHHPDSRNDAGKNGVSVGFTGHYRLMRDRFGDHLFTGCAGENLVVDADRTVTLDEVAGGLVILSPDGVERCRLSDVTVAHPCRPFSGFALRHEQVPPETMKATLQFLEDGTRGYYCATVSQAATVVLGDLLAVGSEAG